MAKKWKGYPWPDDRHDVRDDDEDEEIDVVGDAPSVGQIWGPSSPTAAATAPSPPPHASERIPPIIYNGECILLIFIFFAQVARRLVELTGVQCCIIYTLK